MILEEEKLKKSRMQEVWHTAFVTSGFQMSGFVLLGQIYHENGEKRRKMNRIA